MTKTQILAGWKTAMDVWSDDTCVLCDACANEATHKRGDFHFCASCAEEAVERYLRDCTMYTLQPRAYYRPMFDGSDALFRAAWKQYRSYLADSIDNPTCDADVNDWLDSIAAEMVNDSDSPFYIYG